MIHYVNGLKQLQACFEAWDVELIPLGPRRLAGWTSKVLLPSLRVTRVHAGRSLVIRGTVSPIDGCLILSASRAAPVRSLGQPIDAGQFVVTGKGARIDLFLPSDATLCVIAGELLTDVSPRRAQMRTATSECVSQLARCAASAADNAALPGGNRRPHAIDGVLTRQMRITLKASTVMAPGTSMLTRRATAVERACRFIASDPGRPISLADLCKHCGVGARTLEYGFRQFYDTTPIGFVKSQRLTRTHNALTKISAQPLSISDIARRLGFTHMSQYAQDYRSLFGESPSMTLQGVQRPGKVRRDTNVSLRT